MPYAGSGPLASSLALNKPLSRQVLRDAGLRMPRGFAFRVSDGATTGQMARHVFDRFPPPYIVKPPSDGSSHGIRIAQHLVELPDALGDVLDAYGAALVEEFIFGREAVVGIIDNYRNQPLYALPPARVVLPGGARMIERSHYLEDSIRYVVPSDFTQGQKDALMDAARRAHQALGLTHFSQAEFKVTPRHVYLIEINTNPILHSKAVFPQMLEAVGSSVPEFLSHAITQTRGI